MLNFKKSLFFLLVGSIAFSGTISGTVTFEGKVPKRKKLKLNADPVCGSAHKSVVLDEKLIVNDKNQVKNVLVWVKGAKGGFAGKAASLDQNGCIYSPHVLGIQKGQELLIKNSDATLHNIHSMSKENSSFNFAMPKVVKEKKVSFDKTEEPFAIKCDVHPWMKSYVSVFDHGFFAVTDENGHYSIEGVPAGEYEVIAWQERFKMKGAITQKVTVKDGNNTSDFKFVKKSKKKK
jgi:plastocyanin